MSRVTILDVIAFKEDGETKHMVPYELDGVFACTQAYGKDPHYDEGSLKRCWREIIERVPGMPNGGMQNLQDVIVVMHFVAMGRGANRAGQPYPLETRPTL